MAIQLSATMATNLVALNSITSDLDKTQTRLNTGKAINSATDNPALYAKAQSYSDRADKLTSVNQTVNTALKNMSTAGNALDTINKNFDGLLTTLRDAKTKAVTPATAVNTKGGFFANAAAGASTPAVTGAIVGTKDDLNSSDKFQVGDVFAITMKTASGSLVTRNFTAVAPSTTPIDNAAKSGKLGNNAADTRNAAFQFSDLSTLAGAIRDAFGSDNVNVSVSTGTGDNAGKTQLNFAGVSADQQFTMSQVVDADTILTAGTAATYNPDGTIKNQAVAATTSKGTTVDFSKIFGAQTDSDQGSKVDLGSDGTLKGVGVALTYGSAAGTASNKASLETRKLAADAFKRALYSADNMIKDAYMPGFANLLQGKTMKVEMSEVEGDSTQFISLGSALDMTTLGFAGYKATVAGDGLTLESTAAKNDFNNDTDLDSAITQVTNAMTTLRTRKSALDQATANVQTRLDFNKDAAVLLSSAATEITASDAKQDAANLASIQNRQSFAMNNLAITKQNEQGLMQLLR